MIKAGAVDLACIQLQDALNRTDEFEPPSDFVAGTSKKKKLATMITGVMNALACP